MGVVAVTLLLVQAALGGAFLIVLALGLMAGVVVAAALLGGALSGEVEGGEQGSVPIIPPGTLLAALGLGLVVIGALYSFSLLLTGFLVGGMAYYRGARVLGVGVSVLALVGIFVAYLLGTIDNPNQFSF